MKLITIPFSHFCEKARWGLDHFNIPFEEERHLPLFHMPAVRKITQAHHLGKSTSTPVLITDEGEVYNDSRKILRYLSDTFGQGSLYPNADASKVEDEFHDRLAPITRCYAYIHILSHRPFYNQMMTQNVEGFQKRSAKLMALMITRLLKKFLKADVSRLARMQQKIEAELECVGALLDDNPFLAGDTFSAADIAFACAIAPALLIGDEEGYGAKLPGKEITPQVYLDDAAKWRSTKAGQYALKLFREYR